jgi:hypothetical protein
MKAKYQILIALILLSCVFFLTRQVIKLSRDNNRMEINAKNTILEKDSEIQILSKKEMVLKVAYEMKDSAYKQACKDRDINKRRVTELTEASMSYQNTVKTKLVPWPIHLSGEPKIIKISDYSDGWNTIHNELDGDSLTNILTGRDSLILVNHYGWYGWKVLPRFTREKWSRTELINHNPRMHYKIDYTSKREK